MKFRGIIKNGGLSFAKNILEQRKFFMQSVKDGTAIVEDIKKDRSTKTQKQCASIFGVYLPIVRQSMIDQGQSLYGVAPSTDMVKDILYKCCGGVGDNGESKTLSQMDIVEAGRFIENIQDFHVTQFGHPLPPLDPDWRKHFNGRG